MVPNLANTIHASEASNCHVTVPHYYTGKYVLVVPRLQASTNLIVGILISSRSGVAWAF